MDTMLSEFDYFNPIPIQSAILDEYEEPFSPTTAISAGSTIDFKVTGEPSVYRDLSNSYIVVQCKVTQADNANLQADALVAPVNLLLHSMFSSVDILVCGKRVGDKDTLYPYRAFMETLLTFSDDVLRTRANIAGWCMDLDANSMDRTILATTGGVDPNPQFVQRHAAIADSRVYTLVGRPHADIFHQNLDIPPECSVDITLTPSESKFALMAIAAATFKLVIISAKLYVRSKLVATDLVMAHRTMLDKCDIRIPYTSVNMRKYPIAAGAGAHTISELFNTKLPKRIVVGLATHDRVNGAYNLNPFKFQNFGLTEIGLTVGGQPVPREALKTNFNANAPDYGRAYLSTLASLSMDIGNRAIAFTPQLWSSAYNLYAFKLVPGPIDDGPVQSYKSSANVCLSLTFAAALTANVDVIIYSESNALLSITKLNSAIVV